MIDKTFIILISTILVFIIGLEYMVYSLHSFKDTDSVSCVVDNTIVEVVYGYDYTTGVLNRYPYNKKVLSKVVKGYVRKSLKGETIGSLEDGLFDINYFYYLSDRSTLDSVYVKNIVFYKTK